MGNISKDLIIKNQISNKNDIATVTVERCECNIELIYLICDRQHILVERLLHIVGY